MSFFKSLLFFTFLCFLASCQNNERKDKPVQEETKKVVPTDLSEQVVIPGKTASLNLRKAPTLSQEELKPFLFEYGKQNPETQLKITTEFGDIIVELFTDTPLHRANFVHLTKLGYFDTTFFYRVDKGFVIQGGNSDKPITQKFRAKIGDYLLPNESRSSHAHVRGAVSMAKYREQNISKASSPFEFFIVQSKTGAHHLDDEHTVFGKVVDGMDVVDKINSVETDDTEWPLRNVQMKIETIR